MEYVEVFEALQRGTVDCTFAQTLPSEESGLFEVAKHVAYTTEQNSLSGRSAGANLAGSGFQALPLAYQQIIFDSQMSGFAESNQVIAEGHAKSMTQLEEAGGEIGPMADDTDQQIGETNDALFEEIEESGLIGTDVQARTQEAVEKWQQIVADAGIEDGGGYEDMNDWYVEEDIDFDAIAEQLFQEAALPHRPGA